MPLFRSILISFILVPLFSSHVIAQASQPAEQEETEAEKKPAGPTAEEVWQLEAEAVLAKIELTAEIKQQIITLYLEKRRADVDARAEARAENLARRMEQIEQMQDNNFIAVDFLDEANIRRQMDMIKKQKQQELAKALVALVEKPTAEKLWPYLGQFDPRMDQMVEYLMTDCVTPANENDSEEVKQQRREALLASTFWVEEYTIAIEQVKRSPKVLNTLESGRQVIDPVVYKWYVERFRGDLIRMLNQHLDSGRVEGFIKRFRLQGKKSRRTR